MFVCANIRIRRKSVKHSFKNSFNDIKRLKKTLQFHLDGNLIYVLLRLSAPQHVLRSVSSCDLAVRGAGGLPEPPALDPGFRDPGEQFSGRRGRQHLPPQRVRVLRLAAGGEDRRWAAVWQAGCSEVCSGQQTPQRQTCSGEKNYSGGKINSDFKDLPLAMGASFYHTEARGGANGVGICWPLQITSLLDDSSCKIHFAEPKQTLPITHVLKLLLWKL